MSAVVVNGHAIASSPHRARDEAGAAIAALVLSGRPVDRELLDVYAVADAVCRYSETVRNMFPIRTTTDSAEGDVRRAATQFAQQPDDTHDEGDH